MILREEFIIIDQLCLRNLADAIRHWTSQDKTDFIPSDQFSKWNSERESVLQEPSEQRLRLFLLSTFVKIGTEPQVERLLKKWNYTDQLDETCGSERTVLMLACIYGQTDIAALLCASGAKVNLADAKGWTALHHAAYYVRHQIVEKLLEHGAAIDLKTSEGYTPLNVLKRAPNWPGMRQARAEIRRMLKARR
jgi:hypothetical protein